MGKELTRLVLPKPMLRRLETAGIYCQTWVTAEKQVRAGKWVLRGVESGGSTRELGRYLSFFSPKGARLPWLQKVDRVGFNGIHAVVIGDELASVEMARVNETYQLLIAKHRLVADKEVEKRPRIESAVVFRGIDGQLPHELLKKDLTPEFLTRSGEIKPVPQEFVEAIRLVTAGVACANCRHCHGLVDAVTDVSPIVLPNGQKTNGDTKTILPATTEYAGGPGVAAVS
jgi:hypothetical protein